MYRNTILLLALCLLCAQSFCQRKEQSLSLYTSVVNGNFFAYPHTIGREAKAHETKFLLLGMEYSRKLKKNLSFHIGAELARHTINVSYYTDNPFIPPFSDNKGTVTLLSVPVSVRLSFLKYFFIQGGFLVDKQIKNDVYDKFSMQNDLINDQSGIGSLLKLGAAYRFKKYFTVFTGLYTAIHGLVFFQSANIKKRLVDGGLQIGVTYRF